MNWDATLLSFFKIHFLNLTLQLGCHTTIILATTLSIFDIAVLQMPCDCYPSSDIIAFDCAAVIGMPHFYCPTASHLVASCVQK